MWGRKRSNIKQEVAQAAGHVPTEAGMHAFLTLLVCKWTSAAKVCIQAVHQCTLISANVSVYSRIHITASSS